MFRKDTRMQIPSALLLGLAAGLVVTILVAVVTATLIAAEKISENGVGVAAMVATLLGAATSALVTVGKVKQMRFVMCLAAGAVYLLGLMCCAAIAFDGVKSGVGAASAVVLGGVLAVFLMRMNRGQRPKYKVPKLRS